MPAEAYRAALRYRLLIDQFPMSHKCVRNKCEETMDSLGYHIFCCQGKLGGQSIRHNSFAKDISKFSNELGIQAKYNDPAGYTVGVSGLDNQYHQLRPGDVTWLNDDTCIDATIVSPLSVHADKAEGTVTGLMAEEESARKHKTYDQASQFHEKMLKSSR